MPFPSTGRAKSQPPFPIKKSQEATHTPSTGAESGGQRQHLGLKPSDSTSEHVSCFYIPLHDHTPTTKALQQVSHAVTAFGVGRIVFFAHLHGRVHSSSRHRSVRLPLFQRVAWPAYVYGLGRVPLAHLCVGQLDSSTTRRPSNQDPSHWKNPDPHMAQSGQFNSLSPISVGVALSAVSSAVTAYGLGRFLLLQPGVGKAQFSTTARASCRSPSDRMSLCRVRHGRCGCRSSTFLYVVFALSAASPAVTAYGLGLPSSRSPVWAKSSSQQRGELQARARSSSSRSRR